MKKYDVVIVGAGPAGSMAAILCARSGLSTLLLEKKPAPGGKSCGGGLTLRTVDLLTRHGCFEQIPVEQPVRDLVMHFGASGRSCTMKSDTDFMVTVKRTDFDRSLTDQAIREGARFKASESFVRYIRRHDERIEVITDKSAYGARAVIGADGYYSRVRKQLQLETSPAVNSFPMLFGIECDVEAAAVEALTPGVCHLFFQVKGPVMYGWAFPRNGEFNIGVVIEAEGEANSLWMKQMSATAPVRRLRECLSLITPGEIRWKRIGGAPIPLFTPGRRPVLEKQNIYLVGDAAGFADAWTGEGIYYALASAELAHKVISADLEAGVSGAGVSSHPSYSRMCEKTIVAELMYSFRFHRLFKRFPSAWQLLQYRRIRELFIPFTTGRIGYRQALLQAVIYSLLYKLHVLRNL